LQQKSLNRWYQYNLSEYLPDIEAKKWGNKKLLIADEQTGEVIKEKMVYIAKPEHVGECMALDDKQIGNQTYSIMTNSNTGKIAFLVPTVKADELKIGIKYLGDSINKIRSISCDMAPSYLNFCENAFKDCTIVIDKFHVIRYVYDAVQKVRMRIKAELILSLPKGKRTKKEGETWTIIEQLHRSRYLLNQSKEDWTKESKEMMDSLFKSYPDLEIAYYLAQDFKSWYDKRNCKKPRIILEQELFKWLEKVEKSGIEEFKSAKKMIEKHEENIINYFQKAKTNAIAERVNGKIKRFISNNYGVHNLDFLMYRLKIYFS
jgi:transposase